MSRIVDTPPAPGAREHTRMITASKVPAILGISRFKSQYTMWHEMAGNVPPEELNKDRMVWGHIAEPSLAGWWVHKHPGAKLNPRRGGTFEIAYTSDALPFANMATLDRRAYLPSAPRDQRFHIVECKTAMTLDDWGRPGEEDSVPADYYAQVMFQMGVSGIHQASAVVLGPFGEPEIHDITFDRGEFDAIVDKLVDWQASLEMGLAPALDTSASTYETVRGLHPKIDPEGEVQISLDQAKDFIKRARAEDEGKAIHREARNEINFLMGKAKYLKCGDVKIADRRVKQGGTPYVQIEKKADLSKVNQEEEEQ